MFSHPWRLWIAASFYFFSQINPIFAQTAYDVSPGQPAQLNGVEYGVEVLNERSKDVKTEEYNRVELGLYVANRSGCTKLIFPRQTLFGTESDPDLLATFDCLNATGKRMTSKSGTVSARPFTIPYKQTVKSAEGKDVVTTTDVPAGFILRNGESITNRIIVIVPSGEQPRLRVRIKEIVDTF
ncbi:ABC transporter permease [Spirosoma montaniterrae]|uniref:ABC transporter permease n=1 Tax=Spirosoma montaniterrae TaxID=1178516 RepID=A0A1P9WT03_9BACT|nr:ABC transporter permease [Spirosoma montaniterrae]AQG78498.1 ABC transporter permease [Spirosoma montaniterrae]